MYAMILSISPPAKKKKVYTVNGKWKNKNKSLCDDDEQDQDDNEHNNDSQTPILPRLSRKTIQASPRPVKLGGMSIDAFLYIFEQESLAVEFIPNLHAQLALAANARAQAIELLILVADDLAVVFVDLLVVEVRVVGWSVGVGGVVAVRE